MVGLLEQHFTTKALLNAYRNYQNSKIDRYQTSSKEPPKIKIPMGADGIDYTDFDKNHRRNLSEISRKILSGRYFFYPFREVLVPKVEGKPENGLRPLRIARIRDVIVQKQLYKALYETVEDYIGGKNNNFSVAYRKGYSVNTAISGIKKNSIHGDFLWVLDADIQKFFDEIDHHRLMKIIDGLFGSDSLERQLIWRYIRVPSIPYGKYKKKRGKSRENYFKAKRGKKQNLTTNKKGIPQGGVLSGMLANIFLHEFDDWVINSLGKEIELRYYRYADDFVILVKSLEDACKIVEPVETKFSEMDLRMHEIGSEKTRISQINEEGLDFLGFRFKNKKVQISPKNIRKFKTRFITSISRLDSHNTKDQYKLIQDLIKYYVNPKIMGPPDDCEICNKPKRRYSWISYFAPGITDTNQLKHLDVWIRKTIYDYLWKKRKIRIQNKKQLVDSGLVSLVEEYKRVKKKDFCRCDSPTLLDS